MELTTLSKSGNNSSPAYYSVPDCRVADFATIVEQPVDLGDFPLADRIDQGVVVYDSRSLRSRISEAPGRLEVQAEFVRVLSEGPGVLVLSEAFDKGSVSMRQPTFFAASSRPRRQPERRPVTISPLREPMIESGMRWKSSRSQIRMHSSVTTPTTCLR